MRKSRRRSMRKSKRRKSSKRRSMRKSNKRRSYQYSAGGGGGQPPIHTRRGKTISPIPQCLIDLLKDQQKEGELKTPPICVPRLPRGIGCSPWGSAHNETELYLLNYLLEEAILNEIRGILPRPPTTVCRGGSQNINILRRRSRRK